jgi:ribosomal protein S18 acetylase RimI-like enzyme
MDFITAHAYRLLDFDLPAWRQKPQMTQADIEHITHALSANKPDDCIFIAVDENGERYGFIRVLLQTDYYTGETHAHVGDVVVIAGAEGRGTGKLLLEKADDWAKEQKTRWITLNVFEENTHARDVYEKAGYKVEWIKYLKEL